MSRQVDDETRAKIREHYMKGQGSMQDYARIYDVPMSVVLEICDATHLGQVEFIGDLVDESEIGRQFASEIKPGAIFDVPTSLN